MPSAYLGNNSGGDLVFSGGTNLARPNGGGQSAVTFVWDPQASGYAYLGLSAPLTINSGSFATSGLSGAMDGVKLAPGSTFQIPLYGSPPTPVTVYARCDQACSGLARLYWQQF